jgi:hypothetical protein
MKKNVHLIDRLLRLVVGVGLVAWAVAGGPFWAYLGVLLLATGAWGVCPMYWVLFSRPK